MLSFFKYQGSGNDFILVDNRSQAIAHSQTNLFQRLCDRHFGAGADGLILLEDHKGYDFEMFYVNADGKPSSMCGNGGRCCVAFAKKLGLVNDEANFMAIDGAHHAKISASGHIDLHMRVLAGISRFEGHYLLDTGSPHLVLLASAIDQIEVTSLGKALRNRPRFKNDGVNINFLEEISSNTCKVRTYERGVEQETLSCGTGVTAAALVISEIKGQIGSGRILVSTRGGDLMVSYVRKSPGVFEEVILSGPAVLVYEGQYDDSISF